MAKAPNADADTENVDVIVLTFKDTIVKLVRQGAAEYDLTSRQLGVLLVCYLDEGPHTVRGLAARLHINKSAVTRTLDRLEALAYVERKVDRRDRRSVLVKVRVAGTIYVDGLGGVMRNAFTEAQAAVAARAQKVRRRRGDVPAAASLLSRGW